ncbi:vam6/Vps39-like protein [Schistocerca gregaria]|uniref:vam6/Vps39-like protein n=1 Tax=Schistocerca gregaria TaxID=7010 RepID=UPI00211F3D95|nr:vam6/Vps39-like protein [Schistocerca gregaria]
MVALWNGEYMLSMGSKVVPVQGDEPSWEGVIELSEYATRLSLSYPYLVALTPRSCEVRCLFSRIRMEQSFVIGGARWMATSENVGEGWESSKLRCGGAVYIASRRQIWSLNPCPVTEQLEELMEASRYEEATLLCRCLSRLDLPNRDRLLSKARTRQAFRWFREGQYARALQVLSTLKTNALVVLGMYPRRRWRWSEEKEESLLPEKWWNITQSMDYEQASSTLEVIDLDRSIRELIGYLWEERHRWHNEAVANVEERTPSESNDGHFYSFFPSNHAGTALSADSEKTPWNDTSDLPVVVDTVLLQILLHLDEGEQLLWLLSGDNHCHLERCADLLMRLSKYRELLMLYRGHGEHEAALKWLKMKVLVDQSTDRPSRPIESDGRLDLIGSARRSSTTNHQSPTDRPHTNYQGNPSLLEPGEWQYTLIALKNGDQFDSVTSMIAYLSTLTSHHLQLIFNYSSDLLRLHPREALRVFTSQRLDPSMNLPRISVLEYLKQQSQKALEGQQSVPPVKNSNEELQEGPPGNRPSNEVHPSHDESARADLVRDYLEEMIFANGDQTLEFHDELLKLYLDPLLSSAIDLSTWENSRDQKHLLKLFEISHSLRPEYILSHYPLTEYSLYREKAALLAKLGEHKAVLKECIFKLRDLQEAEAYCEKITAESRESSLEISNASYNVDAPAHTTIFCQFLELLLQPPSQEENETVYQARLSYAWTLLEKHYRRFPLQRVFSTLPTDTPLQRVQGYLELVLKDMVQLQRHTQVLLNMEQSNAFHTTIAHKQLQAKYVNVDENTNCKKCQKKIGLSIFIYIPGNGDTMHYQCYKAGKHRYGKDSSPDSQSASTLYL